MPGMKILDTESMMTLELAAVSSLYAAHRGAKPVVYYDNMAFNLAMALIPRPEPAQQWARLQAQLEWLVAGEYPSGGILGF